MNILSRIPDMDAPEPLFRQWLDDAFASEPDVPDAMSVATVSAEGKPSVRMVLLKSFDGQGFVFYTNYSSRKAQEIETNPYAALAFYWPDLGRQVRVEGRVRRVPPEQSAAYFRSRPKGSQLGAWASHQSQVLPSRAFLDEKWAELQERYRADDDVPVPEFWGGYCVVPQTIEFWEGRSSRLHDRIQYRRNGEDAWVIERLSP